MEDTVKEHSSAGGVSSNSARPKLLRYALRSTTKSSKEKSDAFDLLNSATSKRGRPISSVSKSMGIVDLSGKETCLSAKLPRRLSNPGPKHSGNNNITPISETRTRRSDYGEVKRETPTSEISRWSSRNKFNTLSSASFWLSQIKASEYAAKHSISLGFFKLALQAGCEPHHLKRLQEELKCYVHRHQLAEVGETVKQLFESYNISENTEKLEQVSECVSQIPEEETTRVSDDDVHSSCTTSTGNLKPKCLNNTDSSKFSPERKPSKKETCEKGNPGSRVRGSLSKSSGNGRSGIDSGSRGSVRRPEKPRKEESNNREKGKIRKQGKKSHVKQCSPSLAGDKQGNKENMDARSSEEISLKQEV